MLFLEGTHNLPPSLHYPTHMFYATKPSLPTSQLQHHHHRHSPTQAQPASTPFSAAVTSQELCTLTSNSSASHISNRYAGTCACESLATYTQHVHIALASPFIDKVPIDVVIGMWATLPQWPPRWGCHWFRGRLGRCQGAFDICMLTIRLMGVGLINERI